MSVTSWSALHSRSLHTCQVQATVNLIRQGDSTQYREKGNTALARTDNDVQAQWI